jgi:hypothetical protein
VTCWLSGLDRRPFNHPDHEVSHCYLLNSPPGSH